MGVDEKIPRLYLMFWLGQILLYFTGTYSQRLNLSAEPSVWDWIGSPGSEIVVLEKFAHRYSSWVAAAAMVIKSSFFFD